MLTGGPGPVECFTWLWGIIHPRSSSDPFICCCLMSKLWGWEQRILKALALAGLSAPNYNVLILASARCVYYQAVLAQMRGLYLTVRHHWPKEIWYIHLRLPCEILRLGNYPESSGIGRLADIQLKHFGQFQLGLQSCLSLHVYTEAGMWSVVLKAWAVSDKGRLVDTH